MESDEQVNKNKFALILPVLFYEYLALSMTKSVVPGMIISTFGDWSYLAVGIIETSKGVFSFISAPLIGKLSDQIGRRYVLLGTVVGTTFPVCLLAFTQNMWVFAILTAVSGLFTATFTVTFAYISDCVDKNARAPAFGLALATFGLSFCIGPVAGGFLNAEYGLQAVFISSFLLVVVNIIYILTTLPETVQNKQDDLDRFRRPIEKINAVVERLPNSWNFSETFRIFKSDPFLSNIALIVFVYYTAVWAIVSTLMVYVTRQLKFSPISVGWMLSGYGLATMFSEGVLVRLIVPLIGELQSIRLGLLAFSIQCVVLAFSSSSTDIFFAIIFSMLANLVYPSVSSLLSKIVEEEVIKCISYVTHAIYRSLIPTYVCELSEKPTHSHKCMHAFIFRDSYSCIHYLHINRCEQAQGEAMGALNGIKALTEGFGPLFFGTLMALFEHFPLPGAPYLLAGIITFWALMHTY